MRIPYNDPKELIDNKHVRAYIGPGEKTVYKKPKIDPDLRYFSKSERILRTMQANSRALKKHVANILPSLESITVTNEDNSSDLYYIKLDNNSERALVEASVELAAIHKREESDYYEEQKKLKEEEKRIEEENTALAKLELKLRYQDEIKLIFQNKNFPQTAIEQESEYWADIWMKIVDQKSTLSNTMGLLTTMKETYGNNFFTKYLFGPDKQEILESNFQTFKSMPTMLINDSANFDNDRLIYALTKSYVLSYTKDCKEKIINPRTVTYVHETTVATSNYVGLFYVDTDTDTYTTRTDVLVDPKLYKAFTKIENNNLTSTGTMSPMKDAMNTLTLNYAIENIIDQDGCQCKTLNELFTRLVSWHQNNP